MPIFSVELSEYRKFTTTVYVKATSREEVEDRIPDIYCECTTHGFCDWEPDFETTIDLCDGYVGKDPEDQNYYDLDLDKISEES